jgi:hypothetical protein
MFHNDLEGIPITTKSIEEVLLKEEPVFMGQYRNSKIEWRTSIPLIAPSFYSFVLINERIPTQNEFWDTYRPQLGEFSDEDMLAIEGRVRKAYPSLVRDVHFYCLLREDGAFQDVIYNLDLDLHHDIDILVKYCDKYFGLALFLSSRESEHGRAKKGSRHTLIDGITYIEVPFELQGSRSVNRINLYDLNDAVYVLGRIRYNIIVPKIEKNS